MATALLVENTIPFIEEKIQKKSNWPLSLTSVKDPSLVPVEFPSLQFERGAAAQITALLEGNTTLHQPSSLLITSPYNLPNHLLDLNRLPNVQDRILALALTQLTPVREDYATAVYEETFNWGEIGDAIRQLSSLAQHPWTEKSYFVVIFRSQLKVDFDRQLLWELDRESHREAVESGGLLKYWFGQCNGQMRNLATCWYAL